MQRLLKPLVFVVLVVAVGITVFSIARDWRVADAAEVAFSPSVPESTLDETMAVRIRRFCGDCHPMPNPAHFPAAIWHSEVKQGYEFYARSGRQDLDPPPMDAVLRHYLKAAPEFPRFTTAVEAAESLKTSFRIEKRFIPAQLALPEIATLQWLPMGDDGRHALIACDMQYGQVVAIDPTDRDAPPEILTRLYHPARLTPCALSGDGSTEFLVADLGSYKPGDHQRGRVVLLKRKPDADRFETIELASGFGRVADVRCGDFDRDGKEDFLVAEFGWQKTGGIWLFQNTRVESTESLQFTRHQIDARPGVIHVPVHDFDGDGWLDFAAIVSQEFESVELFFNATAERDRIAFRRDPAFDRYTVWAAPDLTFGSSGLRLSDLNQDGRMDLVVTSGDSFDNNHVTPLHGVHWLENQGGLQFRHHRLASLPGAYAAQPCDIDSDGDLDVVVSSLLPRQFWPAALRESGPLTSVLCLEQIEPGKFVRHTLEEGSPHYSSLATGDFDADGDVDFAVGSGPMVAEGRSDSRYLTIWWNKSVGR